MSGADPRWREVFIHLRAALAAVEVICTGERKPPPAALPAKLAPEPLIPLAVTVREGARLLGIGNSTMWKLIHDGKVQTTMVGGRRLINVEHLKTIVRAK